MKTSFQKAANVIDLSSKKFQRGFHRDFDQKRVRKTEADFWCLPAAQATPGMPVLLAAAVISSKADLRTPLLSHPQ